MTRLLVLAEGDSEELFVREMLAPHLADFGVYATATAVQTKRLEGYGIGFRKTAGVAALKEVGLSAIRAVCPHFAGWLNRLEALGQAR